MQILGKVEPQNTIIMNVDKYVNENLTQNLRVEISQMLYPEDRQILVKMEVDNILKSREIMQEFLLRPSISGPINEFMGLNLEDESDIIV